MCGVSLLLLSVWVCMFACHGRVSLLIDYTYTVKLHVTVATECTADIYNIWWRLWASLQTVGALHLLFRLLEPLEYVLTNMCLCVGGMGGSFSGPLLIGASLHLPLLNKL